MERRISVRTPIRCRIECAAGTQTFVAEAFDMSESGVSFGTSHELPLNTEVMLRYRLEDDGPMISAKVRICQQSGGRYGAMFLAHKAEAHPA